MAGSPDKDCVALLQWALPQLGLRWRNFHKVRGQVCKRIRRRMESLELEDFTAYRARLERHRQEWAVLDGLCRVTISRFYRDRNVFQVLGEHVLPQLARHAAGERHVRCWAAGCASGEEVYTMRILRDLALARGHANVRFSLLGTDIDEVVLARASAGCYRTGTLREMPKAWIERCFERRGDLLCIKPAHRQDIVFRKQDIRQDMPRGPFDLILCRNLVLTYFELRLQTHIMHDLVARLRCGGYLVIGAHEALPERRAGFQSLPQSREVLQWHGEPASV